jgi:hypothetical protein
VYGFAPRVPFMLAAAFDGDWPPSVTSDAAATKTASTTNPANLRIEMPFEGLRPEAEGRRESRRYVFREF